MSICTQVNPSITDDEQSMDSPLERIVKLVMKHLPMAALECRSIQLHTQLTVSRLVCVTPTYDDGLSENPKALALSRAVMSEIERQFLVLVCQSEQRTVWNKARVVINNNADHTYRLALRYDADLEWLESLPQPACADRVKHTKMIALIGRPKGAGVDELCRATGWQPHTIMGAITGTRQHLQLNITLTKKAGEPSRYQLSPISRIDPQVDNARLLSGAL